MKLKDTFITQESDGEQIMVSVAGSGFVGLVRNNATAAFIVNCLKSDTTREEIINKMIKKYDASAEEISDGVDDVLNKLRSIGALDE